jgi:hypothetical protein
MRTFVIPFITVPVPLRSVIKLRFRFRYSKKLRFRFRSSALFTLCSRTRLPWWGTCTRGREITRPFSPTWTTVSAGSRLMSRRPRSSSRVTEFSNRLILLFYSVLWICNILVPLTNGSGSDSGSGSGSCCFRQWPSRRQLKIIFLLISFWSYIYIIFQRKRSHETVGIKGFLIIFAWL